MNANVAPVIISHDRALAEILAITKADPATTADAIADVLRRRSPEMLTLSQAATRFGVCGRTLLNHHDAGRLRAVNISSGTDRRRLLFFVSDLARLFDPGFDSRRARANITNTETTPAPSGDAR